MQKPLIHPLLRRAAPILEHHASISEMFYEREGEANSVYALKLLPHKKLRGVVLFVHGTGNDACYPFLYLFLTLVEAGFAVMSFDLDGHGQFSKTVGRLDSFTRCIDNALAHCRKEFPDTPQYILGHSIGGMLTLNYLRQHPHAVKAAAIMSMPCKTKFAWRMMLPEVVASAHPVWLKQLSFYGWKHLFPAFGTFGRKAFPLRLEAHGSNMGYVDFVSKLFQNFPPEDLAAKVEDPVLCLYGQFDWIAPISDGKKLTPKMAQGQFAGIPFANHLTLPLFASTGRELVAFFSRQ